MSTVGFNLELYRYTPLRDTDATRILVLLPSSNPLSMLRCQLLPYHGGEYEAVSYTWGSSSKPSCIEVLSGTRAFRDGQPLRITANLDALLRQLRHTDRQRWLWIDAICINQNDYPEREKQVLRMKGIFSRAIRTIIWLGEEDEGITNAVDCIHLLKKNYHTSSSSDSNYTKPSRELRSGLRKVGYRPWLLNHCDPGYISASTWHGLSQLLSRSWFSRVWVFQEIAVSSHIGVQCGNIKIQWEDLVAACSAIEDYSLDIGHREYQPIHTSVLIMHEAQIADSEPIPWGASAPKFNLGPLDIYPGSREIEFLGSFDGRVFSRLDVLLLQMRWAKATDPRDKVYALLGISSSNAYSKKIQPDYSLSLPAVYLQTAQFLNTLTSLSPLAILSFVQHEDKGLSSDLPSWVPDWRQRLFAPWIIYNYGFEAATAIDTDQQLKLHSNISPDRNTMLCRGASLMKIALLSSVAGRMRTTWTDLDDFKVSASKIDNPYSYSLQEAYRRGITPLEDPRNVIAQAECKLPFWELANISNGASQDTLEETRLATPAGLSSQNDTIQLAPSNDMEVDVVAWDWREGVTGIAHGRKLFVSNLGLIGLVPLASQVSDEICLLLGGRVPFVLRKCEGRRFYRLVGECYIFGIMNGEALRGIPTGQLADFVLC